MDTAIDALRAIILGADPAVREGVKWNAPSFYTSEHFATFHLRSKRGVQLVLHLGAKGRPDAALRGAVPDPGGLLDWRGPDRAILTFADATAVEANAPAIEAILREWVMHVRAP